VTGRLVLLRHGQSYGNVDKRLDTRPPGAALTDLGVDQATTFAREWDHHIAMIVHSIALRAIQTASAIGEYLSMETHEVEGIHEVQAGDLEDRNDEESIEAFRAMNRRWHLGDLDASLPDGESAQQVLDRFVPVLTQLRMRYLDDRSWTGDLVVVSHGAAIRLVSAALAGVDGEFALEHHLANTDCVVLSPITDGRWSCVHWGSAAPPFYPDGSSDESAEGLQTADPMG
jgi:broad specificity phosphatase PhoE